MPKIRVLIVDDSVVIRRILSDELSKDPMIEIVGKAATGKIALAMIAQVNPDVVTMDIEMPEMDGLTAVSEIRKTNKMLPIIMFSTLSQRAARETLEALSRGANDYVTKPANVGSATLAMERVREELLPKIKTLCPHPLSPVSTSTPAAVKSTVIASSKPVAPSRIDVLAIGVSTGGPNALADFLPSIPKDFPVPIVLVQHMPPVFTKCLADRLSMKCQVPVHEGVAGSVLKAGEIWIAPGDFHMVVVKKGMSVELAMNQDPRENSCRPAVDVLFRSVAKVYGKHSLAVILTGMGQDGLRGCEVIREIGGQVVVQDEGTSVVWGMPGSVAQAGLAEKILPLSEIASEIKHRILLGRAAVAVGA